MIDTLHVERPHGSKKPRTYRKKARKEYLVLSKQRKPGYEKIQACLKGQLSYVRRNLNHVEDFANDVGLDKLTRAQYKDLLVIQELFRQQTILFEIGSHTTPFWRTRNGSATIQKRFSRTPSTEPGKTGSSVDGVRLSGPKLGRPAKDQHVLAEQKKVEKQDHGERNAIEGKFGEGKRVYGLGLIKARLQTTSETTIALQLVIMNLEKILRDTFLSFFFRQVQKSGRLISTKYSFLIA